MYSRSKSHISAYKTWGGIKEGENCLYISVDKPPQLPIRMAARLKYNVSQLKIMDAVPSPDLYSTGYPVRDITAKGDISFARDTKGEYIGKGELTFEALQIKLNKVFNRTRYDRIVIDSFSTFKRFASDDFKRYIAIQQLFRFFINRGITLLITVDDPENEDISAEVILSTGVIHFYKEEGNGKVSKKIRIMKMRGNKYNNEPAKFYIDKDIIVEEPITQEETEKEVEEPEPEKEKKPKKKEKKTTETKEKKKPKKQPEKEKKVKKEKPAKTKKTKEEVKTKSKKTTEKKAEKPKKDKKKEKKSENKKKKTGRKKK